MFISVTIPDPKWALKMLEIFFSWSPLTTFRNIDQKFVDQHCLFVLCSYGYIIWYALSSRVIHRIQSKNLFWKLWLVFKKVRHILLGPVLGYRGYPPAPYGSPPSPPRYCTYVQLVGNSLRNEYSKTRSVIIKFPTTVLKNLCNYTEENLRIHAERKSAKLAFTCQSGSSTHTVQSLFSPRIFILWNIKTHPP